MGDECRPLELDKLKMDVSTQAHDAVYLSHKSDLIINQPILKDLVAITPHKDGTKGQSHNLLVMQGTSKCSWSHPTS